MCWVLITSGSGHVQDMQTGLRLANVLVGQRSLVRTLGTFYSLRDDEDAKLDWTAPGGENSARVGGSQFPGRRSVPPALGLA
jgi:hypothetical protein